VALETIFLGAAAWIWHEDGKEHKILGATWQQWDGVRSRQAIGDSLLLPPGEED